MKHWKTNDWDEGDDRDTDEFLDLEQKIYLEMFPYNKAMFEDKDEDGDINQLEIVEGMGRKPAAKPKGKDMEEDNKPAAESKVKKGQEMFLDLDTEDQV